MRGWAGLLLVVSAFAAEPVDVQTILERSVAAENADWKAQPHYAYTQTERDGDGPARTYDVIMLNGSRYRRLTAVNGTPLSSQQAAAETEKLQQETRKREHETPADRAKRIQKAHSDRNEEHGMMLQMAKAFNFRLVGEDTVDGQSAWVLEATPRPGYTPPNSHAKVLTGMRGKLWIAKHGYHWVKVEAEVFHPVYFAGFLARVGPGTRFELEKTPVTADTWLPKHFAMKVNAKVLGVFSHGSKEDDEFSNYRRTATLASR